MRATGLGETIQAQSRAHTDRTIQMQRLSCSGITHAHARTHATSDEEAKHSTRHPLTTHAHTTHTSVGQPVLRKRLQLRSHTLRSCGPPSRIPQDSHRFRSSAGVTPFVSPLPSTGPIHSLKPLALALSPRTYALTKSRMIGRHLDQELGSERASVNAIWRAQLGQLNGSNTGSTASHRVQNHSAA